MNTKKRFKWGYVPLLFMLVICMLLGSSGLGVTANAASGKVVDGTDISTTEDLGFYMGISLFGLRGYVDGATNDFDLVRNGDLFVRKEKDVTLLFVFPDVVDNKANNRPVMVTKAQVVTFPAAFDLLNRSFSFSIEEIKVNIRKEYYEHFEKNEGNFGRFKIKMMYKDSVVNLYKKGLGIFDSREENMIFKANKVRLFRAAVDPDEELPDGGGLGSPDKDKEEKENVPFLNFIYNALKGVFNWTLTFEEFQKWVIVIGIALGILLVIYIFRKVFGKL